MELKHRYTREKWQGDRKGDFYYVLKDNGKVVSFYGGLFGDEWSQEDEDDVLNKFYKLADAYISQHDQMSVKEYLKDKQMMKQADPAGTFKRMTAGKNFKIEVLGVNSDE